MKLLPVTITAVVLCLSAKPLPAAGDGSADQGLTNPFFALCVSTHDPKYRTPGDQAKLLKELGYAGMAHVWLDGVPETLQAVDDSGLKLFQIYVKVSLDPNKPRYDPRLKEVIQSLKGRETTIGLLIQGKPPSSAENDPRAVEIVGEIAEMAEESALRVALYPHTGDWLERVEDALRVVKKVDRKNVGVMFNLCHWMRVDKKENMEPLLQSAMPRLFAVTINGADRDHQGKLDRWIQTLDRGDFDVYNFLKMLKALGYSGPIGLQCYGIKGDVRENLERSMEAWQKFSARMAAERN